MSKSQKRIQEVNIIAELANAHEGQCSKAMKMVESVSKSCDAVKIQVFSADDLAVETHENYELYRELSLSIDDIQAIANTAHENDLCLFADVFGEDGLSRVSEVDGLKIHSSDLANQRLIEKVGDKNKPVLLSVGGASPIEIEEALTILDRVTNSGIGLVYGFQNYPTKLENAHLNRLQNLVEKYGSDYSVGYTSHVNGGTDEAKLLPAWATAAGADFVEIHTTLNRSEEGLDYYSSLEPNEFEVMAEQVKKVQIALGEDTLGMTDAELDYRHSHKKCVVTTCELSPGDKIGEEDVTLKRPEERPKGTFNNVNNVVGRTVKQTMATESAIRTIDLEYYVAATLACRAESTRLYGKPLQLLGEKPILSHQISQLQSTEFIDEVILAISETPSKTSFIEFAEEYDLSYTLGDEEDVLKRIIDAGNAAGADLVIRTTTENPFLYHEIIDDLVECAIAEKADLTVPRNLPLGSFIEVVSLGALEKAHKFGADKHRSELVTSFITEHSESFNIVGIEPPAAVKRPEVRLTVDNPCDLILVRKLWDHISDYSDPYNLEEILGHYDNEGLASINESEPDGTSPEVVEQSWHIYGEPNDRMTIIEQ